MSINSRAKNEENGSANLTDYLSIFILNRAIFLLINFLLGGAIASLGNPTLAQIIPDATLGAEPSVVTPLDDLGLPIDEIDGGATRGTNLFHSFLAFNVEADRGAYFYSPAGIQNILARVTGGNPSRILGLVGTFGDSTANLFLINPNGIIFGPNAQLDVESSFVATTANSLVFENGLAFSATAPQSPPLLTINVPLGLQYGGNARSIETQGSRLQVLEGKTLALVGGNLQLNRTLLEAPEGRVELAGVSDSGTIGLEVNNSSLRLNVPEAIARTDVSVNGSVIRSLGDGGSITIYADNLTIDRSSVRAGFDADFGFNGTQAGDITLDAIGEVNIGQGSIVANSVLPDSTGNSGNVNIKATFVSLTDNAQIGAITFGQGNAGKILIEAKDSVSLTGNTSIRSNVGSDAEGNGGDINIQTPLLSLTDGADLSTSTFGQGDSGNITVQANESILLVNGRIYSAVREGSIGKGGKINIQTNSLSLSEGSALDSSVEEGGIGSGGDINLSVGSLSLTDNSVLFADTAGQGNAGTITVRANDFISLTSSKIYSNVDFGANGQAGNIDIQTGYLSLVDGSRISNSTFGTGNAGSIFVQANDSISLIGDTSAIISGVAWEAQGNGGDIQLAAKSLWLTNGAQLFAATFGAGNSGNIAINISDTVNLSGVGSTTGFSSGLLTNTEEGAGGQGGDIRVTTSTLRVSDGAVLSAVSRSSFKGGNINVDANTLEVTNGGQLLTTAFSSGDAGNITVNTSDRVILAGNDSTFTARLAQFDQVDTDGSASGLFARTEGTGAAGNVIVNTPLLTVQDTAQVSASTSGGTGGSIAVTANRFEAINGGQLRTTTAGSNQAGNITLRVHEDVTLAGSDSGLFANTERGSIGNGGSILISNPKTMVIREGASVAVDSQGAGEGGNIQIQAGAITLNNNASISAETASNAGGGITLQVQDLLLMRHGSRISTTAGTAQAGGDGGNIAIDAQFILAVPKENSDITANAFTGRGGNINITTQGIYGLQFRPLLTPLSDITASSEFGVNGTVQIITPDVDPSQGLVNLPIEPVNVEVAQGCQAAEQQGAVEFFDTGRGGLAPNPYEPISSSDIWEDVPSATQGTELEARAVPVSAALATPPDQIVEAQGWRINQKGEVVLVAEVPITGTQRRCRLR
ncbi:two-partner secretion domain-containing protein [Allocoleopsis franciscana]|uniref:Filamentous hemagglutinin family N-terminal domain protein n=1 Tax=Allocoleopsis franciscana PCC 7113 TaxID=1173027 RepID=K9WKB8_9CYAN|nr:filamentous hemagglutinin N-terminal domain-containing protein [Allocoleopsis franciscana]AFZ20256.1 filamentous hemagglutinin family N-terminal domain protein [Allocoleopsis franciscana PCC 7113]